MLKTGINMTGTFFIQNFNEIYLFNTPGLTGIANREIPVLCPGFDCFSVSLGPRKISVPDKPGVPDPALLLVLQCYGYNKATSIASITIEFSLWLRSHWLT